MKKGILAFLALAFAFSVSYAAERYKDRMFEVDVERDVVYATDPSLGRQIRINYATFDSKYPLFR